MALCPSSILNLWAKNSMGSGSIQHSSQSCKFRLARLPDLCHHDKLHGIRVAVTSCFPFDGELERDRGFFPPSSIILDSTTQCLCRGENHSLCLLSCWVKITLLSWFAYTLLEVWKSVLHCGFSPAASIISCDHSLLPSKLPVLASD